MKKILYILTILLCFVSIKTVAQSIISFNMLKTDKLLKLSFENEKNLRFMQDTLLSVQDGTCKFEINNQSLIWIELSYNQNIQNFYLDINDSLHIMVNNNDLLFYSSKTKKLNNYFQDRYKQIGKIQAKNFPIIMEKYSFEQYVSYSDSLYLANKLHFNEFISKNEVPLKYHTLIHTHILSYPAIAKLDFPYGKGFFINGKISFTTVDDKYYEFSNLLRGDSLYNYSDTYILFLNKYVGYRYTKETINCGNVIDESFLLDTKSRRNYILFCYHYLKSFINNKASELLLARWICDLASTNKSESKCLLEDYKVYYSNSPYINQIERFLEKLPDSK